MFRSHGIRFRKLSGDEGSFVIPLARHKESLKGSLLYVSRFGCWIKIRSPFVSLFISDYLSVYNTNETGLFNEKYFSVLQTL